MSPQGLLSGVPAPGSQGTYNPQITARDNANGATTVTLPLTISSTEIPPLQFTTPSTLPPAKQGRAYNLTLSVSGGYPSYSNWMIVAGALPPGMALSDQFLVGNPTTFGTFTFTIQVSDAIGFSTRQAFDLVVTPAVTITTMLYAYPVGAPLSILMSATGGMPPYTWLVTGGSLPQGLTLSSAGLLAGTPTTPGSYSFSVRVTDSQSNSATATLNIGVLQPLKITTTTLPSGSVGVNYGIQLTGSGGYSSYSWSLISGSLPPGLSLTSGGNLDGIPSAIGTYSFSIQLTDGATAPVSQSFSIIIGQTAFSFTTSALPTGLVNSTYFGGFSAKRRHTALCIFARLRFSASWISDNKLFLIRSDHWVCIRDGIVHIRGAGFGFGLCIDHQDFHHRYHEWVCNYGSTSAGNRRRKLFADPLHQRRGHATIHLGSKSEFIAPNGRLISIERRNHQRRAKRRRTAIHRHDDNGREWNDIYRSYKFQRQRDILFLQINPSA